MNFYQFKVTFTLRVNITRIPFREMRYVQLSVSLLVLIWQYRDLSEESSTVLSLPEVPSMEVASADPLCIQQNEVKTPSSNLAQNWNPCE